MERDLLKVDFFSLFKSQSLVNEGRFPQDQEEWKVQNGRCRNPSLMRAGFHINVEQVFDEETGEWKVSQSLVNEGRFPLD